MGVDITKAALAAGHAVVATGGNTDTVKQALGEHDDLLVVTLDRTSPNSAEAATRAAVERFGRIDVVVNNAGNFYAGFFEEFTPNQIDTQLAANLLGPMNVTRAVLPVPAFCSTPGRRSARARRARNRTCRSHARAGRSASRRGGASRNGACA